jgi:protein TonB
VNAPFDEPLIPPRLRRPLAAAWISLGVHAAAIGLLQVAPPAAVSLGEPVIEARLVPAHAVQPAAETPPAPAAAAPEKTPEEPPPRLVPIETAEALPVAAPLEQPVVVPEHSTEPEPEATGEPADASPAPQPSPAPVSAAASAPAPDAAITTAVDLTYYNVRDLDVQPRALREIVPDYPADADRRRLSGKVRLQLELEADGRITDIDVVSGSPPGVFEASAIRAFREARFAPAQKNGRPVRARVVIEVLYDWEGRARNQ